MSKKEEQRRKIVCNFFDSHPEWSKARIVSHFVEEGMIRRTVYNILATYASRKTTNRKVGSGKTCTLNDPLVKKKLRQATQGKVAKSYKELARKFQCDDKTVKKHLQSMGMKRKTRKSKPATTQGKEHVQKQRLQRLVKEIFFAENDVICIRDDESYFTLDGNEWQWQHYFQGRGEVENAVKYIEHSKFPKKVLLWLAISSEGMSEPVFFQSGLAVNSERYIAECLPKVAEFIKSKHKKKNTVFWPDLASSHYAKNSLEAMKQLKIPYVPKDCNPPNVPQLRPIEDF